MTELEALDDDVLALLRAEKDVPELAPHTKAALFATVASRVGLVPGGDGGNDGGGTDGGGPQGGGGVPAGASGAAAVAGPGGFALVGGKAAAALLGMFAIGIATGVTLDRGLAPTPIAAPPALVANVAASAPPPFIASETPATPVGALPAAPAPPVLHAPPAATAAPPPSARGLAAERALLDVARGALARGEAGEALAAAGRHEAEYPTGALVEEREAIAIKALVALGRRDEARARAAEMERRFPNGLMLRAVKGAVEAP